MDAKCELCGEPMPKGEEMFKYHGYSGPCPKPPLAKPLASIEHGPFAVMSGAPWNVLDSRGVRIALCGGDSNSDHERFGPSIAAAIVQALNDRQELESLRLELAHMRDTDAVQDRQALLENVASLQSELAALKRSVNEAADRGERFRCG